MNAVTNNFAVIETLEGRTMMSGSPLSISEASYMGGTQLKINGTAGDDQITVSLTSNGLLIQNGDWSTTKSGNYKSLMINAAAGNDSVSIAAEVTVDAIVYGGEGNDILSTGSGNDRLYGGLGKNVLNGNAGDDILVTIGGASNDILTGAAGNDSFWADARTTEIVADASTAEIAGGNVHRVDTFVTGNDTTTTTNTNGTTVNASKTELKAAKQQAKLAAKAQKAALKAQKLAAKQNKNSTPAPTPTPAPAPTPTPAPTPAPVVVVEPTPTGNDLLGQNFADPITNQATIGYKNFSNKPLFAEAGPTASDISQGYIGDCYFLATLAAVAKTNANQIRQSVVDLGDGTYAVQFTKNGADVFVRVDADLATWNGSTNLAYAKLGAQESMWVAIVEKAFTYFRTATNSFASIEAGWMSEAASALGLVSKSSYNTTSGESMLNSIATDLGNGKAVTYAAGNITLGASLIGYHAYTVDAVNFDATGKASTMTLRNPWGVDGINNDGNNDGYVTITAAQAQACFLGMTSMNA